MNEHAKPCPQQGLVDKHFAGRTGRAERTLREHLPTCACCQQHYERQLLFAELDPRAPAARDRLALALGFGSSTAKRVGKPLLMALAGAAAVVIAVIVWPGSDPLPSTGFTARGGVASETTELLLYKVRGEKSAPLVAGEALASDEIAMAYRNGSHNKYLLVFGVDQDKRVYWYHPGWLDSKRDPLAVSIRSTPGTHELPEAVAHQIIGASLTIYGVFLNERLSVRQIEAIVSQSAVGKQLPIANAVQRITKLRIRQGAR